MPDEQNGTTGFLSELFQMIQTRSDHVCPVHVDVFSEKGLDRIEYKNPSVDSLDRFGKLVTVK